jgi:hypothetical protein
MKLTTTSVDITATASRMRRSRFQRLRSGSKKICRSGMESIVSALRENR